MIGVPTEGEELLIVMQQEEQSSREDTGDQQKSIWCGEPVGQACLVVGGCMEHKVFWRCQMMASGRSFQEKHDPGLSAVALRDELDPGRVQFGERSEDEHRDMDRGGCGRRAGGG